MCVCSVSYVVNGGLETTVELELLSRFESETI